MASATLESFEREGFALPLTLWEARGEEVDFLHALPSVGGWRTEALFGSPPRLQTLLARAHPEDRSLVSDPLGGQEGDYALAWRLKSPDGGYRPVVEHGRIFLQGGVRVRQAALADAPALSPLHGHDAREDALVRMSTHPALVQGDVAQAAPFLVRTSSEVLGVSRVGLWLFDDEQQSMRLAWIHQQGLGTRPGDIVLPLEDAPAYIASMMPGRAIAVSDALNDPRTRSFARDYLVPNGIVSILDAPIRVGGRVVGVLCNEQLGVMRRWRAEEVAFAADVAERVAQLLMNAESRRADARRAELETRLARAGRLEAVGRLAGGVAHDFNNVLFCMLTNIEFARRELDEKHPVQAYLSESESAGWRAAELVRQLLAFSRRQVLQPTLLDLHTLVQELGKMLRRLVPESIELVIERGEGPGLVRGDRAQLEQVVVNLVVNARDAVGESGRIVVSTRLGQSPDGSDALFLEVQDSGPGVPESLRDRIFEPFFTTKSPEMGTGLGLSTVFGVVRQHEGDIEVSRGPSGGALFRVWLPAAMGQAQEQKREFTPRPPQPQPEEKITVLIAEDEDLVRSATRRLLEREGYQVIEARDGVEAVRIFTESSPPPALIVLDAVMPRMGGRETYEAIRASGARPRFLLVTGYDPEETLVEAEDVAVLNKPYGTNDLLRAVRRLTTA